MLDIIIFIILVLIVGYAFGVNLSLRRDDKYRKDNISKIDKVLENLENMKRLSEQDIIIPTSNDNETED